MKYPIGKYIILGLYVAMIWAMSSPLGGLPVIGHFLNPFTGFTHNARMESLPSETIIGSSSVHSHVDVHVDSLGVPHIFADNDEDMYYIQGYMMAQDRLWQLDIQGRSGLGELSEVVGVKALENDRLMRRLGLPQAAHEMISVAKNDGTYPIMEQFSRGVNDYTASLSDRELPIEFKLMNYRPRNYTPLYSAALLKLMALRLTAMEADMENTNFVHQFGKKLFDDLYPNFYPKDAPIIPVGTSYDYVHKNDTFNLNQISKLSYSERPLATLDRHLGSNNWAISPSKSTSGNAILCNDPHLKLNLPAIWYEMHLTSPTQNVYGVTMPGAPGIVIGFNANIAWGVTNAGRDVRNWYEIQFKDNSRKEILVDYHYEATRQVIEKIYVKNQGWVTDTVLWTRYGPVVYDATFHRKKDYVNLALSWTTHLPSNELKTFLQLNKTKNHDQYRSALSTFYCPGQNFVFASTSGDIAIQQQGLFPMTAVDQDKFVLDGRYSSNQMNRFIPIENNPHVLNPPQGFVMSANQHPTDASYPYYYSSGDFEAYRNRRIETLLSEKPRYDIDDMKRIQCDNFGLMASEMKPIMIAQISMDEPIISKLKSWNNQYTISSEEATFFDIWYHRLEANVWDELLDSNHVYDIPNPIMLYETMKNNPTSPIFDIQSTSVEETMADIVRLSYQQALVEYDTLTHKDWMSYKNTEIAHLSTIPALGRYHIATGGNKHIVNATWRDWAPSWRMIVEMRKNRPFGYVIYPGGNSGHPASPFYDNFVNSWAQYQYHRVELTYKSSELSVHHSYYFKSK